jgi:hypothetical protein
VLNWVISPVPELEADLERKDWLQMKAQLSRKLAWNKTEDLENPWEATVDGAKWQVRLNRFPFRLPFTLIGAGQELGTSSSGPRNGSARPAKPGSLHQTPRLAQPPFRSATRQRCRLFRLACPL